MKILVVTVVTLGIQFFSGCIRYADLHDQTRPTAPKIPSGQRVSAKNCMFTLFYAFPFGPHPLPETKAQADAEGGGQGLVNVDVETDYIWAVIGTVICTKVTGEPAVEGRSPVPVAVEGSVGVAPTGTSSAGGAAPSADRIDVSGGAVTDAQKQTLSSWEWRKVVVVTTAGATHLGTLNSVADDAIVVVIQSSNPGLKTRLTLPFKELKTIERQQ
ncbi:MAG: hypothetical protein IV100_25610 [Myxococcales bacterium]|nr:hypothetical protein [Myxococcales bacterium]